MLVAVNKMDLADWDESAYSKVDRDIRGLAARLEMETVMSVPVSATDGDNVAVPSANSPWYSGPTILDALDHAPAGAWASEGGAGSRLPVQWVVRQPGGGRGYAGMVSGGALRSGDKVVVLPSGTTTRIASLRTFDGRIEEARARMSVTVDLEDDLDVSRGDTIASADSPPRVMQEFDATLCWFSDRPALAGTRFRIKHTTRVARAQLTSLGARLDIGSLELEEALSLSNNEIGTARVRVATPLAIDPYRENRVTGSFIVIDEATNATVAAGMVGTPEFAKT
jgi:bifunctional enzyme CysN/CysC